MNQPWRARATIDLTALKNNVKVIKRLAGGAKIAGVVKADAYGHGVDHIVPVIKSVVDYLAVATISEAIQCRHLDEKISIIVLSEFFDESQIPLFVEFDLQPVVYTQLQLSWLRSQTSAIRIWLKYDSGMNRLGFDRNEIQAAIKIVETDSRFLSFGLMSHLGCADEADNQLTLQQIERCTALHSETTATLSVANSAAIAQYPQSHFDLVRSGLMMYGCSPNYTFSSAYWQLESVMQLHSRVFSIKVVRAGENIGYGASFTATKEMRIAVIGFGYADGYPRLASNRGYIAINGRNAPIVGKISMDTMTVDIKECGDVNVGDIVELWGVSIDVNQVAEWAETIPYEVLRGVSSRVERKSINHR